MMADRPTRRMVLAAMFGLVTWSAARADDADSLAGTWTWMWRDAEGETHRHVLEIEGSGPQLSARERFDALEPVKVTDLKVTGAKIHFSVLRGDRRATYDGTLAGHDTINGTVIIAGEGGQPMEFGWTAARQAQAP